MELPPGTDSRPLSIGVIPRPTLPAAPGDEEMFRDLYLRMQLRGFDHASRFLSASEAEDAVSDGLSEVWQRWKHLTLEQRTAEYCLGAIHHHVLKRLRHNKRMVSLQDAEAELTQLALHEIEAVTRATTLEEVIDLVVAAMPPRRRDVFLLVRELRYTYKEVGEMLSMSEGTVNTHVRLANADIRAAIAHHGGFRLPAGTAARLGSGIAAGEVSNV